MAKKPKNEYMSLKELMEEFRKCPDYEELPAEDLLVLVRHKATRLSSIHAPWYRFRFLTHKGYHDIKIKYEDLFGVYVACGYTLQ